MEKATSLNQAAFVPGTAIYRFGYNSIPNIRINGAPDDTNYNRWSMLHDGNAYRLYFFKGSTSDTLYQFGYDGQAYTYGHNSIPELKITGAPNDTDYSSFSMLHDGSTYRLYLRRLGNPTVMYQFGWNGSSYHYGYNSIRVLSVQDFPRDTDYNRWDMLHDGNAYRLYAFQLGSNRTFYQGSWNGNVYKYAHNSIPKLNLEGTPESSLLGSMGMLHDVHHYRFYFRAV